MEEKRISEEELEQVAGGGSLHLKTGEYVTNELIDRYAELFKSMMKSTGADIDAVIVMSHEIGFPEINGHGIADAEWHHGGRGVDYWATIQKAVLRGGAWTGRG